MLKKMFYSMCAGLVLLSMVGCNLNGPAANSPLIGTWNMTKQINSYSTGSKDSTTANALFSNKYTFSDDYSLSGTTVLLGMSINFSGTWSTSSDSVTLNVTLAGSTTTSKWKFAVSGSELTLSKSELTGTTTKTTVEKYAKQ
jgi:hypothetical protein